MSREKNRPSASPSGIRRIGTIDRVDASAGGGHSFRRREYTARVRRQSTYHPLYGEIPLLERRSRGNDGREYSWFEYDPSFQPKLPEGAVPGDVSRQQYCTAHHVPKYFYVDECRTCVQCKGTFTFSATEQKFWYETLQFNFGSLAIRCRSCRKRQQTERALREQIGAALRQLETSSDDPVTLLDLSRATVRYRERTGHGNLDRAVAASRKAFSVWPESPEPLFWEGKCHYLAGRDTKGTVCLTRFIEEASKINRLAKLVSEAKREVAAQGKSV